MRTRLIWRALPARHSSDAARLCATALVASLLAAPAHAAEGGLVLLPEAVPLVILLVGFVLVIFPANALIFQPLIIAPLIIWLIRKDESAFNDDHGREVINFGISFFVLHLILIVTLIGAILIPVLWIVALVNIIRGAVAASSGEYFRYPMTFRFLS